MSVGITSNATDGSLDVNATEAVPFDVDGLKIGAFKQGVLPFTESFTSAEQTITAGGTLSITHLLTATPTLTQSVIICKTAELGFSIGDELVVNSGESASSTIDTYGIALVRRALTIEVTYSTTASVFRVVRLDTGATAIITPANWRLIARAWV